MKNPLRKLLIISLLLITLIPTSLAMARAGGGGGGGGGRSSSRSRSSKRPSTPLEKLTSAIIIISTFCYACIKRAKYKAKIMKKKSKSISAMKKFEKDDDEWNYSKIKKDITDCFYNVQKAWMERNQNLAKKYMSEEIYNLHKRKTDWLIIKGEKNILNKIELLKINPLGAIDSEDDFQDVLWVNIKASMIDYTLNLKNNEIINGDPCNSHEFEEFWKFIRRNNRWVLDEIRQVDEIEDIDVFYNKKI